MLAQSGNDVPGVFQALGVFVFITTAVLTILWIVVPFILLRILARLTECVEHLDLLNRNTRTFFADIFRRADPGAGTPGGKSV